MSFQVLTEFRFEVGSALLRSEQLQGAVNNISTAADNALLSFQRLGMGIAASMGLGSGGLLGLLGKAIETSDNFNKSQLAFSNTISANMDVLTGDISTFADRMKVASNIMKDIAKDAAKFSLDEKELLDTTKLTANLLVPKGLAGTNFKNARDLSRNLMKSAPSLGINTFDVQGQLIRSIEGSASMGDTLFRRLVSETSAFKDLKGAGGQSAAQKFNAMPLEKRFQMISKGLGQFATDMDVLTGNANTLSALFQRLKNIIFGLNGILKPLGDVILPTIKAEFANVINFLNTTGREAFEQLAQFIKPFVTDMKTMVVNLLQLKNLGANFKAAGIVTVLMQIFAVLRHFGILGKIFGALGISSLGGGLLMMLRFLGIGFFWIGKAVAFLLPGILAFAKSMAIWTVVFQLFSRAIAIAHVNDALALSKIIPGIMKAFNQLKTVFGFVLSPILKVFDGLAELISPLFRISHWLEIFRMGVQFVADTLTLAMASIQGIMFSIFQLVDNLKSGNILKAFQGVGDAFNAGAQDMFAQVFNSAQNANGVNPTVQNQITMNVQMKNEFKNQMEPDRIAFTIKEQLLAAAQNNTQSRGRALQPAFGGGGG